MPRGPESRGAEAGGMAGGWAWGSVCRLPGLPQPLPVCRYLAELCGVGAVLPGAGGEPRAAFPTVSSGSSGAGSGRGSPGGLSVQLGSSGLRPHPEPRPVPSPGREAALLPLPRSPG